jgi:hypothetical protein
MRFDPLARRIMAPALAVALAATVAACSSSSSSSPSSPSSSGSSAASAPPSASAPASSASASSSSTGNAAGVAQIKANWEAFFSGKTSAARKIQLLQNGEKFATVIRAQAGSGLASAVSAKVKAVVINSATSATVSYDIVSGSQVLLPNQTGTAVYQDGIWKVGDVSFCKLLQLQGSPPSICS